MMRRKRPLALPEGVTVVPPNGMTEEEFDEVVTKAVRDIADAYHEQESAVWAMANDLIRRASASLAFVELPPAGQPAQDTPATFDRLSGVSDTL